MEKKKKEVPKPLTKVEKRQKLIEYLKEGYSVKKAMELAGYSESTIRTQLKRTVENNIDADALRHALKPRSYQLNHMALDVAEDLMSPEKEHKTRSFGAKLALDNAKIHLSKDNSPVQINFSFATIDSKTIQFLKDELED